MWHIYIAYGIWCIARMVYTRFVARFTKTASGALLLLQRIPAQKARLRVSGSVWYYLEVWGPYSWLYTCICISRVSIWHRVYGIYLEVWGASNWPHNLGGEGVQGLVIFWVSGLLGAFWTVLGGAWVLVTTCNWTYNTSYK